VIVRRNGGLYDAMAVRDCALVNPNHISKGPPSSTWVAVVIMRLIALVFGGALALSTSPVAACPDGDHAHENVRRAEPSVPLTPPSRQLIWGDVNVIHTTDSHGWLLGHQKTSFPEPYYRCVFGLLWMHIYGIMITTRA